MDSYICRSIKTIIVITYAENDYMAIFAFDLILKSIFFIQIIKIFTKNIRNKEKKQYLYNRQLQ
mgnify:FL=1|jgi:hypothetical protein